MPGRKSRNVFGYEHFLHWGAHLLITANIILANLFQFFIELPVLCELEVDTVCHEDSPPPGHEVCREGPGQVHGDNSSITMSYDHNVLGITIGHNIIPDSVSMLLRSLTSL